MIKVQKLRKVYKVGDEKVVALNNINLEIEQGEFCCIVGTSGSGKSTLLNMLAGLEKPTRGKIAIDGKLVNKMNEKHLAKFRQSTIGFVFQSYNLMPTMTAVENVALPLLFKGVNKSTREKRAKKILVEMGLGDRLYHKPGEMSGGQQQRVGIARAFVARPKVIFADEPTGNLDSHTTQQVMKMLIDISQKNNITFVMVTHDPNLARRAPRVVKLIDGTVVSDIKNGVETLKEPVEKDNSDFSKDKNSEKADKNVNQIATDTVNDNFSDKTCEDNELKKEKHENEGKLIKEKSTVTESENTAGKSPPTSVNPAVDVAGLRQMIDKKNTQTIRNADEIVNEVLKSKKQADNAATDK
jgi:putative ABC transport system ATP-binding protein